MSPGQISRLLSPYFKASPGSDESPSALLDDLATYLELLLRWNERMALTAVRTEAEIVTRHFGESLFAARVLLQAVPEVAVPPLSLADLGSGAGFPGLPIALYAAHRNLALATTLIESNQKKAAFLREVARTLSLGSVQVQVTRVEPLTPDAELGQFDIVTMRAVERFDEALPVAAGMCAPGGRLAILIGSAQVEKAHAVAPSIIWDTSHPIPESRDRVLLIGKRLS